MLKILLWVSVITVWGACGQFSSVQLPDSDAPDSSSSNLRLAEIQPEYVEIVSFNIETFGSCYGDTIKCENREKAIIKMFNDLQMDRASVYFFQEIKQKSRLTELLPRRYKCESYDRYSGHQFVVVCFDQSRFDFLPLAKAGGKFAFDSVAMSHYRPLVAGVLKSKNYPYKSMMVGAVHLKAKPGEENWRTRQRQLVEVFRVLDEYPDLPKVVGGDFNFFYDEKDQVVRYLTDKGAKYNFIDDDVKHSYLGYSRLRRFDYFIGSKSLAWLGSMKNGKIDTHPLCATENPDSKLKRDYTRNISDHCPIRWQLSL